MPDNFPVKAITVFRSKDNVNFKKLIPSAKQTRTANNQSTQWSEWLSARICLNQSNSRFSSWSQFNFNCIFHCCIHRYTSVLPKYPGNIKENSVITFTTENLFQSENSLNFHQTLSSQYSIKPQLKIFPAEKNFIVTINLFRALCIFFMVTTKITLNRCPWKFSQLVVVVFT